MLAHLSRNVCENFMFVLELDLEHRVREGLEHRRRDLDGVFFRQLGLPRNRRIAARRESKVLHP